LEDLLEIASLEITTDLSRLVHIQRTGGREFQILGAVVLKLRGPDEVKTEQRADWYLTT